jgi:hypothetical protein
VLLPTTIAICLAIASGALAAKRRVPKKRTAAALDLIPGLLAAPAAD